MLNEIYFGIIEQHVYCVDENELIDEDCLELFRDIEYSFDMYEQVHPRRRRRKKSIFSFPSSRHLHEFVHRLEIFSSLNFVLFSTIVDQFD